MEFQIAEANLQLTVDDAIVKIRDDGGRLRVDLGHWGDLKRLWPLRKQLTGGADRLRNLGVSGRVYLRGIPIYRWNASGC